MTGALFSFGPLQGRKEERSEGTGRISPGSPARSHEEAQQDVTAEVCLARVGRLVEGPVVVIGFREARAHPRRSPSGPDAPLAGGERTGSELWSVSYLGRALLRAGQCSDLLPRLRMRPDGSEVKGIQGRDSLVEFLWCHASFLRLFLF